ncbi:hypothetical protein L1856_25080 [Streptomyces sp. Tue 6430]|nr:hypothetical protein [Streptomyces sp. Tue 6430]
MKDLLPAGARRAGDADLEIRFGHNRWEHDEDLVVRCTGVSRFPAGTLDVRVLDDVGAVVLDSTRSFRTPVAAPANRPAAPARSSWSAGIWRRSGWRRTARSTGTGGGPLGGGLRWSGDDPRS